MIRLDKARQYIDTLLIFKSVMSLIVQFAIAATAILFSLSSHTSPLDNLLLGWKALPEEEKSSSYFYTNAQYSSWYKKSKRELSDYQYKLEANVNQRLYDSDFKVSAKKVYDTLEYSQEGNHLRAFNDYQDWNASVTTNNLHLSIGNRQQEVGVKNGDYKFIVSKQTHEQKLKLDAQSSLDNPEEGQFIFYHHWKDYRWGVLLSSPSVILKLTTLENTENNYQLVSKLKYHNVSYIAQYDRINLDYGEILLQDPSYFYGAMDWNISTKRYVLARKVKTYNNHWWQLSLLQQDSSFTTVGQVSLIDIIGQSAHLAGANWFWGIQGSFKNIGVEISKGWIEDRWEHVWKVNLNKLEPYVNSKLYKSVILIGLPNLEEEEESDIEYAWLSQVEWSSKYNWESCSFKGSIKQLLPLYLKEPSSSSSSGSGSSSYTHVGYTINLAFQYHF